MSDLPVDEKHLLNDQKHLPIDEKHLPIDHKLRLAALDPLRSVCVTAPAGSGKTELLSQRVLTLLARADQPEEILAITFTRKAAAEMHLRIIQALRDAQHSESPQQPHKLLSWQQARAVLERDRQCGWQLLSNVNRLKVQTIDSLCASLTRQMPILSNFGAQPSIGDQPELCYQLAVDDFLSLLEGESIIADDLAQLLSHVDNDIAKLERLLIALLQRRDQWLLHIGMAGDPATAKLKLEQTLQQVSNDVLSKLRQQLAPYSEQLLPLLDYAGCNCQWQHGNALISELAGITDLPSADAEGARLWRAVVEVLLTKTHSWRKSVDKRVGFPTETQTGDKKLAKTLKADCVALLKSLRDDEALLAQLIDVRHLPGDEFTDDQWQMLESLTRLLPSLVAQLTLVFQARGEVDYSQIAMAASQALGEVLDPTQLAMKLDYQLRHILVDEFQDTASTQFQLLKRLMEGWAEHNINNPDNPRTVFIVGDGMQSIYGFREANVGLFLGAKKTGINGVALANLPLTVNFRSTVSVVQWINQTFSQAFPAVENLARGAVPFERAAAFASADSESDGDSNIRVLGFSGVDSRLREARKTVELVAQALHDNPSGSIAILVRSRGHLKDILPALSAAAIPWQATDIDPLLSYSPIIDLLTLTKALFNPADRLSWAALLRSPAIGLDNQDLHQLLTTNATQPISVLISGSDHLANLSRHGRERLAQVGAILNAALSSRQRLSARSWVEGVWLALGGAASLGAASEFAYIDAYFELLERHQQGESLVSLSLFEEAVAGLYAGASQHCPLQVMTIHKAKGLEFDTVILPAVARAPRSDDRSLLMWREYLPTTSGDQPSAMAAASGLLISPLAASGDEEDSIYQHLRYEQAQSRSLENTRLFYVAATRAISHLYILFSSEQSAAGAATMGKIEGEGGEIKRKPPGKNSLISSAWPALADSVEWFDDFSANSSSATNSVSPQIGLDLDIVEAPSLQRLSVAWQAPEHSFSNPLADYYLIAGQELSTASAANDSSASVAAVMAITDNAPELNVDPQPRCVGIVCHWVFEQLISSGIGFWTTMEPARKQRWLEGLFNSHDLPEALWPGAVVQLKAAVDATVNDAKGQWLLSSIHAQSHSEISLLSSFGDKVKEKIIDRSFVDEQGLRWIVDFKTATPLAGEDRSSFIERESALYRGQLLDYKVQLRAYLKGLESGGNTAEVNANAPIKTALYFTHYPHWQEIAL